MAGGVSERSLMARLGLRVLMVLLAASAAGLVKPAPLLLLLTILLRFVAPRVLMRLKKRLVRLLSLGVGGG